MKSPVVVQYLISIVGEIEGSKFFACFSDLMCCQFLLASFLLKFYLLIFHLLLREAGTGREDMADCIFFFQEFADKGVSPALSCLSLKVYDADGVALLYSTFYTFNAPKEMRTFDDFAVKNGPVLVSCFVGEYSKMLGERKVSDVVLFQDLL